MIENFENADQAETHAKSGQTSGVANKSNERHLLVFLDFCVVRIFDENFKDSKIISRIVEHEIVKVFIGIHLCRICLVILVANASWIICRNNFFAANWRTVVQFKNLWLCFVAANKYELL